MRLHNMTTIIVVQNNITSTLRWSPREYEIPWRSLLIWSVALRVTEVVSVFGDGRSRVKRNKGGDLSEWKNRKIVWWIPVSTWNTAKRQQQQQWNNSCAHSLPHRGAQSVQYGLFSRWKFSLIITHDAVAGDISFSCITPRVDRQREERIRWEWNSFAWQKHTEKKHGNSIEGAFGADVVSLQSHVGRLVSPLLH